MTEPDLSRPIDVRNTANWFEPVEKWMKAAIDRIQELENELESAPEVDTEELLAVIVETAEDVERGIRSYSELMEKINDAKFEATPVVSTQ